MKKYDQEAEEGEKLLHERVASARLEDEILKNTRNKLNNEVQKSREMASSSLLSGDTGHIRTKPDIEAKVSEHQQHE